MSWAVLFVAALAFCGSANGGVVGFLFAGGLAVLAVVAIAVADRRGS